MEHSRKIIQKRNDKEDVYQGKEILENNFESRKKGYTTTIFGIKEEGLRIKHRNGKITKLMLAKAISVKNGDALVIDAADDIAFELKEDQQIDRNVLKEIAYEYERQSELKDEICNYLGIVEYTEKDYKMDQKSLKVEEYVKQNVVSHIIEERNERKRVWEERCKQRQKMEEQRRKFTESLDAKDYVTQYQETARKRLENPYLIKKGQYRIDGKIYEDYDGINTQTGDILRIRKLDKIGKDGNGTYLYQGYINSTPNEDDAEILDRGKPMGMPICFDLPKRFSDIEKTNNPQEIQKILQLLSSVSKYANHEQLIYIGGIDKQGNIYHKPEPDSLGIANAIKRLIREFEQNNGINR